MKLWLISQDENIGYDVYDGAVVAAETEEGARHTMPKNSLRFGARYTSWCSAPDKVRVELLGEAVPGTVPSVILASFNAG